VLRSDGALARFDRFRRFSTVFLTADASKARRDGVLRLSCLAINGRRRSKNGAKTVTTPIAAERRLDQRRLSARRKMDEGFVGHE
jgi:hypothetical protein